MHYQYFALISLSQFLPPSNSPCLRGCRQLCRMSRRWGRCLVTTRGTRGHHHDAPPDQCTPPPADSPPQAESGDQVYAHCCCTYHPRLTVDKIQTFVNACQKLWQSGFSPWTRSNSVSWGNSFRMPQPMWLPSVPSGFIQDRGRIMLPEVESTLSSIL